MRISLGIQLQWNRASWTPGDLLGTSPYWSVLGTNFQDVTGTTPADAVGDSLALMLDGSENGLDLSQSVTAQQPARDESVIDEATIPHTFFDLGDSLEATLPDLGSDASKWTVTPYAVHAETGLTIGAGAYNPPTNDWGVHGVTDQALTAADISNLVKWAKGNNLTGVDYPTLKTRMDVICMNAVDVFVYDTTKDSDGGAWRTGALAQASSWYNETLNTATRGSRREFPAVAVIVAESNKVTIYDGDDPSLPMWMVFNGATTWNYMFTFGNAPSGVTSVACLNGRLAITTTSLATNASTNGVFEIVFPADTGFKTRAVGRYKWQTNIADRNASTTASWLNNTIIGPAIVSDYLNDVAMTVLPDAPIDPATGLPVPTIAVATAGGVSVIKDDGTVVSGGELNSGWAVTGLFFDGDATLWATEGTAYSGLQRMAVPPFEFVASIGDPINGGYGYPFYNPATSNTYGAPQNAPKLRQGGILYGKAMSAFGNMFAAGNTAGISKVLHNSASQLTSLVNYTTSTYNTGWMNGDIKGAFLSDTDDTDLVGSGELVTGTWVTPTNYDNTSTGTGSSVSVTAGTTDSRTAVVISGLVVGKSYVASTTIDTSPGSVSLYIRGGSLAGNGTILGQQTGLLAGETATVTFVATSTSANILLARGAADDFSASGITLKLADADRSVNNKGLIVNGTITRTPVASGAELVGYSGFSSSNYLEQSYNSDLDFGTGDFCVMGWVKNSASSGTVFWRNDTSDTGSTRLSVDILPEIRLLCGNAAANSTTQFDDGIWRHVTALRSGTTLQVYVNGVLEGTGSSSSDITNTSAILRLGLRTSGATPLGLGSLALLRISATAPTAEQIAKIYEDEKVLFQEKAACTLAGSGDAVTALAHDPTTDVLRVAQSDKTSLFLGLERVGEEDGKATCIAASNGIVAGI